MRFTDYLAWVRVDRAKYLLKHHDLMLDELARSYGFRGTAYFCSDTRSLPYGSQRAVMDDRILI